MTRPVRPWGTHRPDLAHESYTLLVFRGLKYFIGKSSLTKTSQLQSRDHPYFNLPMDTNARSESVR